MHRKSKSDRKSYSLRKRNHSQDGDRKIAFVVKKHGGNYEFEPVEIELGNKDEGYYAVKIPEELRDKDFLLSGAYYVFSESQKGEMEGHSH